MKSAEPGSGTFSRLLAAAACILAIAAFLPAAFAACGPGSGWVETCPSGTDHFNMTATISVSSPQLGVITQPLVLSGPVAIYRGAPSGNTIPIEITSMDLEGSFLGSTILMHAGDGTGDLQADGPNAAYYSPGSITEDNADPSKATLNASVFSQVSVGTIILHSATPLVLQTSIDRVPPLLNTSVTPSTPIPLLNDQGQTIFSILSVSINGGPGPVKNVAAASGDNQTGTVGQPLANPLVVIVTDEFLNVVPNASVTFTVTAGGGAVSQATVTTNAQGQASTTLVLGPNPGTNTVTATSGGFSATFNATAATPQGSAIAVVGGNNQTGTVGAALASPFIVKVTDTSSNPVAGVPVVFQVESGGGALAGGVTQATVNTDAQGLASTTLTLGPSAGTNTVTATSGTLTGSPITFTATAVSTPAGPAANISLLSGDNQTGLVGAPLSQPFVVQVTDANGIPVSGTSVTFAVTAGGGVLSIAQTTTDASGEASAVLILGLETGPNTVTASSGTLAGSPVTFNAIGSLTPTSGSGTYLTMVSGNQQNGTLGESLPQPFIVQVTDNYHFPVSGAAVTFQVTSGGGTFLGGVTGVTVNTDATGQAAATLTLGTTPGLAGLNFVAATAGSLTGSPIVFTATGNPPSSDSATTLSPASGNNQFGAPNQPLPLPFVVKATDSNGVPVPAVAVTFAVTAGGGTLSVSQATTDSQGEASTTLTLGANSGPNTVTATAGTLAGSPVAFTATGTLIPPSSATTIALASGNNQAGIVGQALAQPFVVKVTGANNVAIPGVPVTFAVTAGGGSVSIAQATTDGQGQASTTLTLGPGSGTNTVAATSGTLAGSPVTFAATAIGATTPFLPPDSVVNGASFRLATQPHGAIAPGSIVSIFGTNLTSTTQTARSIPLPTVLNDTSVTFNGIAAPLFAVTGGQVAAMVPFEVPPGTATVQVKRGGQTSSTQTVQLAAVSPGIFTINQQGTGQGAVLISNTAILAAPSGSVPGWQARPVQRGEYISIFCTGLGDVTNRPPTGMPASGASSVTLATVTATIGGVAAPVSFSGLAGYVGLYQVNVQVPSTTPTGDAVDVELNVGGVSSNQATIAVR